VLTDEAFFGGSAADLQAARAACALPVLRKDFTVSEADVCDARLMGADAVLLIVAALDDAELARLHALAIAIGLDALVEVHDEDEAARAVAVGIDSCGDVTNIVRQAARNNGLGLDLSQVKTTLTFEPPEGEDSPPPAAARGDTALLSMEYTPTLDFPLIPFPSTITREAGVRVEDIGTFGGRECS
jgi:hypothetical protein